jgi:hypothetical protein
MLLAALTDSPPTRKRVTTEAGRVGQVWLVEVDDQALLAKVVDSMCATVAVAGLLLALVGNADFVENRFASCSDRLEVLLLQLYSELL